MKVELIAHTPDPDRTCAMAAGACVSPTIPDRESTSLKGLEHATASGHESVTEHASFTFAVSGVSRVLTHQLVRHRIGIAYSQQSQRYVNMDEFDYVIPESIKNHEKTWDENGKTDVEKWYRNAMEGLSEFYAELIEAGIPEEDARYILPNACTTNIVVTVNVRELRHMAEERMCERAQWEIRELVTEMVRLATEVAPILMKGAGPKCERLGHCPERKGCGKFPKRVML